MVRLALGDAAHRDPPRTAKYIPTTTPIEPIQVKDESVLVLTIHEAATRLEISRAEVERMVAAGSVESLVAGWTAMLVASEVEGLRR